ncbi:MAG: 50S ribosomal protein L3 [Parcubacteria group bacterium]|nr:50S ribosomal protein L3 [Parcubacteria group bacterium]
MKFIFGKKLSMSQVFDDEGRSFPATVIEITPAVVVQVKDKEKDGYKAVQVGFGERHEKNINKAQKGHFKTLGNFAKVKEIRLKEEDVISNVGDKIESSVFATGDTVSISAISKGKGFQGVVKRHGFKGGPRSHGQKHSEREPGSIGGGLRNKVPKAMRMPGRMGSDNITVKNLKVLQIDAVNNKILISGAIPGRRGTLVEIKG